MMQAFAFDVDFVNWPTFAFPEIFPEVAPASVLVDYAEVRWEFSQKHVVWDVNAEFFWNARG